MSAARHLPVLLLALGGATVMATLIGWGLAVWPTVSKDHRSVTEASRCLMSDSSLRRLATSLCRTHHPTLVAAYLPLVLWCEAAAAFCGLWTPGRRGEASSR